MIALAKVLTAPGLADVDGVRLYSAEADVGAPAKRMRLLIVPAADGDFCPVQQGDAVLVGCAAGVAYMLRALLPNTEDAGTDLHRYIQPPAVRLQGSGVIPSPEVRVGARSGGNWEPFMLYAVASADLVKAGSKLASLATVVAALMNAATPGTGTTWKTGFDAIGLINGGVASSGVKGRAIAEAVES